MIRTSTVADIPILEFAEIDSTNAEARRRAEAGEAGPIWLSARRQTAGRGRRGRVWETGPGNLAATLLTTTPKPAAAAAQIAFVAALAVADLARAQVPVSLVTLKWPNDMLVGGRKASGILIESGLRHDGRTWLAVGVGVNLAASPIASDRPATSLADHLRADVPAPMTPGAALAFFSQAFGRRMSVWETYGFEPIRHAWTEWAHGLGAPCVVRLDRETLEGRAESLDESGALRLRLHSGGMRAVTAGDVFFEGG